MDIKIQMLFNNQWHDIDIENLRKDNIIRVFKDGELVKDQLGFSIRKCLNDATYDEEKEEWMIQSEGIKLEESNQIINKII